MNFIDVTPEALPMFAYAVSLNSGVVIRGTMQRQDVLRFAIEVRGYEGPPCQWTCEITGHKGLVTIQFKPCSQ